LPFQASFTPEFAARLRADMGLDDRPGHNPHGGGNTYELERALDEDMLLTSVGWANSYYRGDKYVDDWGIGWRDIAYETPYGTGKYTEIATHPLADAAALASYRPPDPDAPGLYDDAARVVREYGRDYWIVGVTVTTIFETAWALRGLSRLLTDFVDDPDLTEAILEIPFRFHLAAAKKLAAWASTWDGRRRRRPVGHGHSARERRRFKPECPASSPKSAVNPRACWPTTRRLHRTHHPRPYRDRPRRPQPRSAGVDGPGDACRIYGRRLAFWAPSTSSDAAFDAGRRPPRGRNSAGNARPGRRPHHRPDPPRPARHAARELLGHGRRRQTHALRVSPDTADDAPRPSPRTGGADALAAGLRPAPTGDAALPSSSFSVDWPSCLKAHAAALAGLAAAFTVAVVVFGMPPDKAVRTTIFGAAYGLFPIGWIILNVIFLYQLTVEKGHFKVMQASLMGITRDRRLQVLLIAFSFGAFFEGAAGFGTPVAVTAAILIGLGFAPLAASGLSLIANTAPVAYGALGTPVIALAGVTGLDIHKLSAMVGRQLPFFSILVPFWLVWAFAGWRKMREVWPALLVAGAAFAVPQWLISNPHDRGSWMALRSLVAALFLFLLKWKPRSLYLFPGENEADDGRDGRRPTGREVARAWLPWGILSILVFVWGLPSVKALLDGVSSFKLPVAGLDKLVLRVPPVTAAPAAEPAVFSFNWLSFTGTGILAAALISALVMGYGLREAVRIYGRTLRRVRFSLLTVSAMLALGYLTRYSGLDATLVCLARRRPLSLLRDDARLARRRPDRLGHVLERPLRQPPEDLGGTARAEPGAHGLGQQLRRGHGQDDRRPEHRRRLDGHPLVRPRRHDPALCLLP
jgi:lactate permease